MALSQRLLPSRPARGRPKFVAGLIGAAVLALGLVVPAAATAATTPVCQVDYSVTNSWPGGFQGAVTITNNGAPVTAWTLAYQYSGNQMISDGWNGTFTQSGSFVTVQNASYNGTLATGGSAVLGFIANETGTNVDPTAFTLNGNPCNGGGPGAPLTPTVSMTSPTSGQSFATGSSIVLAASAAETGGSISKVEFFNGATLLGTATTAPYTITLANAAAGNYTLTAEAFDAAGGTAMSAAVPITVAAGGTTPPPTGAPQLHVSGTKLLDAAGNVVTLHGANRSGAEFACVQGNGIFDGPVDQASITAMKSWGITAVRVPLNEACWNAESYVSAAFSGATYQAAIKQYVSLLNSNGMDVILDLHWTDGLYTGNSSGCASAMATCQKPMPDAAQAIPFWTSVAATFKGNNSVLFDLFNEPFPSRATGSETTGWQCWLNGGTCTGIGYQVAGMQSLVNAVRSTGASNVIMLGGIEFSNDLTQWLQFKPTDPDGNLVASWHSYNFNTCSTQACWTSQIAPVAASVPVIAGEIGENDCAGGYITSLMSFLDGIGASYLGWTWNAWDCSSGPSLISDYTGTATPFGAAYKAHLLSLPH
ncbi:MAG TPA: cellulase family glycosylhydrolase [Pseudonocardiaceae bacterium]|nr:cellulase family glycosylhydrolase [Pseudonocardiaceae bacterium]